MIVHPHGGLRGRRHVPAQMGWRGVLSRPSWRILTGLRPTEPAAARGLVLVDGVDGEVVDWFAEDIPPDLSARLTADTTAVRPAFKAGDGLLFDEMMPHRTGNGPEYTEDRYALESWFFAAVDLPRELRADRLLTAHRPRAVRRDRPTSSRWW